MKTRRMIIISSATHIVTMMLLLLGGWWPAAPIQAQNDTIEVECAGGANTSGPLRQAIETANDSDELNTIIIDPNCLFLLDQLATGYPEGLTNLPAIIKNLVIKGNGATLRRPDGGAQYRMLLIESGVFVKIEDMTFENGYEPVTGLGGAIHLKANASLFLDNVSFKNNRATNAGGAVYAASGNVTVVRGRFEENRAGEFGGAISALGTIDIREATFEENRAGISGGALNVAGNLTIEHNEFRLNKARNENLAGNGGAINIGSTNNNANLSRNTFVENEAGNGGGLYFHYPYPLANNTQGTFLIYNNLWVKNRASQAGSQLYWRLRRDRHESFSIFHNTFVGDPATTVGLYLYFDSPAPIPGEAANNIIADHSVGLQNDGPVQLISRSNLFQNNATPMLGEFNDFLNRFPGPAAPLFLDAANLDFHLQPETEAIDHPLALGIGIDIEGTSRPLGEGYDMGAYEFDPATVEPEPDPEPDPGGDVTISLPLVVK